MHNIALAPNLYTYKSLLISGKMFVCYCARINKSYEYKTKSLKFYYWFLITTSAVFNRPLFVSKLIEALTFKYCY